MMPRAVMCALAAFLLAGLPLRILAASAVQQVVAKTVSPAAGTNATFEIAVSPDDGTDWQAGSYTINVSALATNGDIVAASGDVAGTDPIPNGQTAAVFVNVPIPPTFAGTLTIRTTLTHAGATTNGDALAIQVVPATAATPRVKSPNAITGTLGTNASFGPQTGQSATLNLSGKPSDTTSFTSSGGVATTPGANKPTVSYQTPVLLAQAGTFSPSFDRDVFSGVTGAGVAFKRSWGSTHYLNVTFLDGNEATPNPFDIFAMSYTLPLWHNPLTLTAGTESIAGPAQTGAYFLQNGAFLGAGYDGKAPNAPITYSAHYGLTEYYDSLAAIERTDRVYDTAFGITIRKFAIAASYVRTGPFYATLSAPGVTPDRETSTLSINVPIGIVQASASVNGYRDNLPGTTLTQATHYWTENASITVPFHSGDSVSLQATNGIQHQTGDPVAPFAGNDSTSLTYATRRGAFAFQYTFSSTNQRTNSGSLVHVWSDGLTVGRAAFSGITLATGVNFTKNEANVDTASGAMSSATASISIDRGPIVFSTQVNHGISKPQTGMSAPPTTTYAYGLTLKPQRNGLSLSATMTENVGLTNSSTGALTLNQAF